MTEPSEAERAIAALTGVLPLRIKGNRDGRDFARAALLFDSLVKFADPDLFTRIIVMTPGSEVELVAERLAQWPDLPLMVMDENDIAPGLRQIPDISGWTRQQILKLAIARHVGTPFYITFDADVICTHAIDADLLLPGGKALMQLMPKGVVPNRLHWWRAAARILKLSKRLDEPGMAPTPAILSTGVCEGLLARLERMAAPGSWIELLVDPLRDRAWHQYLPGYKHLYRWSEYALYYLYCQDAGLLDTYHVIGGTAELPTLLLSENCVWFERDFQGFEPARIFSDDDPALFALIQSNTALDPGLVRSLVAPFLLGVSSRQDCAVGRES